MCEGEGEEGSHDKTVSDKTSPDLVADTSVTEQDKSIDAYYLADIAQAS